MLILVAHGSRDPRWRASVEDVVHGLEAELGAGQVLLAYMDHTPPTLLQVAGEAARHGARTLRVLPLFLADEGHVERDVAPLVEEARAALPEVEVEQLGSLGRHPEFRAALAAIARRTHPEEDPS